MGYEMKTAGNGLTDSNRRSPNSVVLFTETLKSEKEDIAANTKQTDRKISYSNHFILGSTGGKNKSRKYF